MVFVFTGPESSGKSTLTQLCFEKWGGGKVDEFAREYIDQLDRPYNFQDLEIIGFRQFELEQRAASRFLHVWCDTDFITISIWSTVKFGKEHEALIRLGDIWKKQKRYYFLCAPDVPWEYDPQRENPQDRNVLFDVYYKNLQEQGLPFSPLYGSLETRMESIERVYSAIITNR